MATPNLKLGENQNVEIEENSNGDLVMRHGPSGAEFKYDESAGAWKPTAKIDVDGNNIVDNQASASAVYDAGNEAVTEQVGTSSNRQDVYGSTVDTEHAGIKDGTPIGVSHDVQPSTIEIGVTADWHWSEDERLVTLSTLKSRIDNFVDAMNDLEPAFCIHLGDIADGNQSTSPNNATESEMVSRLQDALSYIRTSAGSDGTGLDMPLLPIAGDHEHFNAGNWNMSNIYDAFNTDASDATKSVNTWDTRSEAYYKLDIGGWRLIFLNSGYKDSNDGASKLSTQQLNWLQGAVQTERKIALINHVPVPDGYPSNSGKDSFKNQEEVARLLRDQTVFAINGHVHHHLKEGYDLLYDPYGTKHVQTLSKAENELWAVMRLRDDGWSVIPSYHTESGHSETVERGPFGSDAHDSGYEPLMSQNGIYQEFQVGNTSIYDTVTSNVAHRSSYPMGVVVTNSTQGNHEQAHVEYTGFHDPKWGAPKQLKIGWYPETNSNESFEMVWGADDYSNSLMGFKTSGGDLDAWTVDTDGNGTLTTLLSGHETGAKYILKAEYYREDETPKVFFEAQGVPGGSTTRQTAVHAGSTDNVPTSGSGYRPMQFDLWNNEDTVEKKHSIFGWKAYGPSQRSG